MDTIVLIHGAWHGEWCWEEFIELFSSKEKIVCLNLPGHGANFTSSNEIHFNDYIHNIVKKIKCIDSKIILVGHSFSGFIIRSVANILKEKISKLVYLNAFIPINNESLFSLSAKLSSTNLNPYLKIDTKENFLSIEPKDALIKYMYNQTNEKNIHLDKIQKEPLLPLQESVQLNQHFHDIPEHAIISQNDLTILTKDQIWMCERVHTPYTLIDGDHCPFYSNPLVLKDLLLGFKKC